MLKQQHSKIKIKYKGLSEVEVLENRKKFGANVITPPPKDPWYVLYFEKFDDPIIRILVIAAFLATLVGFIEGNLYESIGIIIAILLATSMSFYNEYKASQEFDLLNKATNEEPVKVIREGVIQVIPKADLVVGDLVVIETGDEIPADGKLLEAISLRVDESKLTGESVAVGKYSSEQVTELKVNSPEKTYPPNVVLKGTLVVDGHGIMEVTAVGDFTEIGKTAKAVLEEPDIETPLNKQLNKLSKIIGVVGLIVALATFLALVGRDIINNELQLTIQQWNFSIILGITLALLLMKVWVPIIKDGLELLGYELKTPQWLEEGTKGWIYSVAIGFIFFIITSFGAWLFGFIPIKITDWMPLVALDEFLKFFMISVTIIVVAVPEGLPMSITLSLAYSMRKMLSMNNLVRHMHACETIGAATVICCDKTGTLTQNKMQVYKALFSFSDNSYKLSSTQTLQQKLLIEAISANSTANLSFKSENENTPMVVGNPTEGALLLWLYSQDLDYQQYRDNFKVVYQWTFNTERKFMATFGYSQIANKYICYVKGAPELLLQATIAIIEADAPRKITEEDKQKILLNLHEFQSRGMRTIALAIREDIEFDTHNKHQMQNFEHMNVLENLIWQGFVAISDPIREDVPEAIKSCKKAGVDVKIITGDVSETAIEIAHQIGLVPESPNNLFHMTGAEFQALSEEEALKVVNDIKILSRARPADKLRMVKLLQKHGHVVAVTGDGTNDAPALNHADVGLAMGQSGTSVAKEASDIILLDDSFSSIVTGILWGRTIYENIQKFILFQLTINLVALTIAFTGPFIGIKMPLTVAQMLWVNLIMDTFAALALATEPPRKHLLNKPPRKPTDFIITPQLLKHLLFYSTFFYLSLVAILYIFQTNGISNIELTLFFNIFVLIQFWNLFNVKTFGSNRSVFKGIFNNYYFILIAGLILFGQILIVQFGKNLFRTVPLSLHQWLISISSTSVVLIIGEIIRLFKRINANANQ